MRAPARATLLIGGAAALASCVLDLAGKPGSPSGTTGTGGAGTPIASTATASATSASSSGAGGGTGGAAAVCGDRTVEGAEECDDGNLAVGDGCSATCTIEALDTCPGLGITLAPPGLTIHGTLTGAHDDLAPSCGKNHLDVVYAITPTVSGTLVATLTGDFEKSLSLRSRCADGPNAELACNNGAGVVAVTRWVYAGVTYPVVVDAKAALFTLELSLSRCGDGVAQGLEECDNPADSTCIGCFKCAGQGEVFDPVSRHCYRLFQNVAVDWATARSKCLGWGGDLVGISSAAESDFLKGKYDNVWSGATDVVTECDYHWINGEPWAPRWRNNEPSNSGGNENCGVFFNTGDMDDRSCGEQHDALCERAPGGACDDNILQPGEECDDAVTSTAFTCSGCVITCPAGQIKDPVTHHCYELVTALAATWSDAQAACAAKGAYLAAVNSSIENGLLQPGIVAPMWIGGSRGGAFRWVNTDPFCFLNWAGNAPAQGQSLDCVTIQPNGTWTNELCDKKKGYVCEHDN
ncbi:MAG: lectin-like protein [Byssovorax sp.]